MKIFPISYQLDIKLQIFKPTKKFIAEILFKKVFCSLSIVFTSNQQKKMEMKRKYNGKKISLR